MIACCSRHVQLLRPHISVLGPFRRPPPPRRCRPSSPVRPVAEAAARWGGRGRGGREGATAFWPRFTRLSISERGRVRERGRRSSAAANDLSQRRTLSASVHSLSPPSCSFRKVRFRSSLSSRGGGEEGKQHTRLPSIAYMHALSLSRLFLHPQCSTYAHKYSSKNCSLLHPCRCCG